MSMIRVLERHLMTKVSEQLPAVSDETAVAKVMASLRSIVEEELKKEYGDLRERCQKAERELITADTKLEAAKEKAEAKCKLLEANLAEMKKEMNQNKEESKTLHMKHGSIISEKDKIIADLKSKLSEKEVMCARMDSEIQGMKTMKEEMQIMHQMMQKPIAVSKPAAANKPVKQGKAPTISYDVQYDVFGRIVSIVSKPV